MKANSKLLLILLFLILGGILYFKNNNDEKNNLNKFRTQIIPNAVKNVVGSTTQFSVGTVKDSSGVYEFELTLGSGANSKKYTSYITKDEKILFTSGVKLKASEEKKVTNTQGTEKKLTCKDLVKTKTPTLTAFIVSNCPYGLQMQRLFKKTIDELPQIMANLNIKYIGSLENGKVTSMHGDKEAEENLRQICLREEQKNKYWSYVSCYMKEEKSEECLSTEGIDLNQLNSCVSDQSRGLKYAKADFDLASKFNIGSSPTLLLNEKQIVSEFDFGGRTPNAIKEIVGCSYQNKPEAYKRDLSKENVASSFSKTDASSNSNNSTANCGN